MFDKFNISKFNVLGWAIKQEIVLSWYLLYQMMTCPKMPPSPVFWAFQEFASLQTLPTWDTGEETPFAAGITNLLIPKFIMLILGYSSTFFWYQQSSCLMVNQPTRGLRNVVFEPSHMNLVGFLHKRPGKNGSKLVMFPWSFGSRRSKSHLCQY